MPDRPGAPRRLPVPGAPRRLPGGIPIPVLVVGLPLAALLAVPLLHRLAPAEPPPHAAPVASADLVLRDEADGGIAVLDAASDRTLTVVPPASNAFLRVTLAGLVRERRREQAGAPSVPFHITRWSDGRLTLDDSATHQLIELNAFGPDNAGAFAHLLDLSLAAGAKTAR